ncbi:MAG: hypothetical protein GY765_16775, partial [bacterium]|nr:hypothetical protein [bacterium]
MNKTLEVVARQYRHIDLLSDRRFADDRLRQVFPFLQVQKRRIRLHKSIPADSYHCIILLLDLAQYSFSSYLKFIRFARKHWKTRLVFSIDKKELLTLGQVTVFLLKRLLYRFCGTILYGMFY